MRFGRTRVCVSQGWRVHWGIRHPPTPSPTPGVFYVFVEANKQVFSLDNQGIQNGGHAFQGGPGCVPPRNATTNKILIAELWCWSSLKVSRCRVLVRDDDHLHHMHPEHGFVFLMSTFLPFSLNLLRFIPTWSHPCKECNISIFITAWGSCSTLVASSPRAQRSNQEGELDPQPQPRPLTTAGWDVYGDCLQDSSIVNSACMDGCVDRKTPS